MQETNNLVDIEKAENYTFVKADICDFDAMVALFAKYNVDGVIHLAAESHVDRSIKTLLPLHRQM